MNILKKRNGDGNQTWMSCVHPHSPAFVPRQSKAVAEAGCRVTDTYGEREGVLVQSSHEETNTNRNSN